MARTLATLALAGSAMVLAGCISMAPKYQRPAQPTPAAWPAGPAYAPAQAATEVASDIAWRDVYVDPRLQAVLDSALRNNRDLRVAIANIQIARAQFLEQRVQEFPIVNGDFGLNRQHVPAAAFGNPHGGTIDQRLYSASVGVSGWEIDLWGRVRSLTKAAQEQYLASKEARRAAQISLISETATAWFTLAADRERLAVAQQTLASQKASYDLMLARFKAGEASELDARQAETTVDQARSDVAAYITQTAQDVNALQLLVGASIPEDQLPTSLEGPSSPIRADLPAGLSSDVLLKRPDVLQAERQLRAANANIGAARATYFPTLSLTSTIGTESTALANLFKAGTGTWSFVPSLAEPIFDWGARSAPVKLAKGQRDVALAQYEKAVQSAFKETADALARRGTIQEQLQAQEANVEANSVSLKLSIARYERGVDPYLNALVAQRSLYLAQQSLITVRLAYYSNGVELYRALGGGAR